MRLCKFIRENEEVILQEWEDFAVTLHCLTDASKSQLRDHAKAMLRVICVDLETYQTVQQGIEKSHGNAPEVNEDTAAESHAIDRLQSGFTVEQLMAEYRALRASVLRLWQNKIKKADEFDLQDMLRFNEAIDQSLSESIARFSSILRDSQNVFLAMLGHDVRNPLGAISMGAQLIMYDTTLPPRHIKVAEQVLLSTQRVTEIVSDLLDYSISHLGGGIPVTFAEYDLSKECIAVVQEMKMFHPERQFNTNIQDGVIATWDRARMSQALSNLIGNAVQHGSIKSPIWVSLSTEAKDVVLVVQNEGEIISSSRLSTMFDPGKSFAIKSADERSASQTTNLGLGLYITQAIVLAHGGKIWATSTQSEGTTVTIRIPLLVIKSEK